MLGQFVVFDKYIANELIKRGFPLREIGGNIYNVYYFDDVAALHDAIEDIKKGTLSRVQGSTNRHTFMNG